MRDANLSFSAAQAVSADGFSTNAVAVNKTGPDGVWVEVVIPSAPTGTTPTLFVRAYAKDTDASWAVTDAEVGVLPQLSGTAASQVGRYFFKFATDKKFVKLYYDVGGTTPVYSITADIVSGPEQDALV